MRKKQTSVFDKILEKLAKISTSTESESVFLDIQKEQTHILNAYKQGYFSHVEYKALYTISEIIKNNVREVLR